ncbi:MAG TPA: SEC-C metal-binding domain-containing protein, partial [Thermoanaerobaculia bacterium]|nr:SEC-C metal-binding domain-containing protein [Thermoanaerobaculia bacterium]
SFYRVPRQAYDSIYAALKTQTDGEHKDVVDSGGLHIIGTERHEARRIDNQLRGRAGRQGDPGSSRFYLSLEDDLMRIFGSDRLSGLMKRLGMEEGIPIEHRWVTKSIERAQTQVEGRNFDTRKHLLEYDDVMNRQREEIYRLRKEILTGVLAHDYVVNLAEDVAEDYVDRHCPTTKDSSEWTWDGLAAIFGETFGVKVDESVVDKGESNAELKEKLKGAVRAIYLAKETSLGAQTLRDYEKYFMLQTVDQLWKDHLLALDHLKEGIGLRGYGQRDPLVEYKKESFQLFEAMKEAVEEQMLQYLFRFEIVKQEAPARPMRVERSAEAESSEPREGETPSAASERRAADPFQRRAQKSQQRPLNYQGAHDPTAGGDFAVETKKSAGPKVGRNDPCPCGSGKKYKKCHGASGTGASAPA